MDDFGIASFISAIKSSKVDGELQDEKLRDNCLNCCNQVKTLIFSSDKSLSSFKYDEFRLNATILLFLGCPEINTAGEIAASEQLIPLIKSIPTIKVDQFFLVLKGLKNNKYLRGVLPWIPMNVLTNFALKSVSQFKFITPLSLAINFEIFFAILFVMQFENTLNEKVETILKNYIQYLCESEYDPKKTNKLLGYHFMYIIESIDVMEDILFKKEIEEPSTFALGLKLKQLRTETEKKYCDQYNSLIRGYLLCLSKTLAKMVIEVTSNMWISWYDIQAPSFGLTLPKGNDGEEESTSAGKSIQLLISHSVHKIRKFQESEDVLNLSNQKELSSFFKHIAVDPNYDPDINLGTLELIEAIKSASESRREKLLSFLLKQDKVFYSEECLKCITSYKEVIPLGAIIPFIKILIEKLTNNEKLASENDWKNIVLELSEGLRNEDIEAIIMEELNFGRNYCLMTLNFEHDFINIFNRLSELRNKQCYDAYLRLCLQSGVQVVERSVDMALNMPGLIPITVFALHSISFICRAKNKEGNDLLTSVFMKIVSSKSITSEVTELLISLIKIPELQSNVVSRIGDVTSLNSPIDAENLLKMFICPHLQWSKVEDSYMEQLLDILKVISELYPNVILHSKVNLASIIVALVIAHHNCSDLNNETYKSHLKIRKATKQILSTLTKPITEDPESYLKEITLVEDFLSRYEIHPRSQSLISSLTNCRSPDDVTNLDQIFDLIIRNSLNHDEVANLTCSRIEWVWALYVILPDCSESEWMASVHLTHLYLNAHVGDTTMVNPTVKIFEEVLLLLCEQDAQMDGGGEHLNRKPLRHCFKCFSSVIMNFMREKLKSDEKLFFTAVGLFSWWCKMQKGFACEPEYPSLFLNDLITSITDLVKSNKVARSEGRKVRRDDARSRPPSAESENGFNKAGRVGDGVNGSDSPSQTNRQTEAKNRLSVKENRLPLCNGSSSLDSEDFKRETSVVVPTINGALECSFLTKEDLSVVICDLATAFLTHVIPNKVSSTVSGKLKNLIESLKVM